MKIKEVPSKIFNEVLDIWLDKSMDYILYTCCPYCDYYKCYNCPLHIKNDCCGGLWRKWYYSNQKNCKKRNKKIADKIVDFIIDRCVYGVPE